ncbi:DUF3757 domain-containing protein [Xanthomonas vasicola]|nr:DUF3757 domain-containing protein [Xanthomonas vasicola]MDO6986025.1 DUF3757 domain-containing protein [Xanthomonas vasicola]
MLLSQPAAGAPGREPAEDTAQCPALEAVHYEDGRYRAHVRLDMASGSGVWSSTLQPDAGDPRHLSSVLYYGTLAATAPARGVLVNCSYTLRRGREVDLAYFDHETPGTQRNLIVIPKDPSRWQPDQPPIPGQDQFYACTRSENARSVDDCAFKPLRLE